MRYQSANPNDKKSSYKIIFILNIYEHLNNKWVSIKELEQLFSDLNLPVPAGLTTRNSVNFGYHLLSNNEYNDLLHNRYWPRCNVKISHEIMPVINNSQFASHKYEDNDFHKSI